MIVFVVQNAGFAYDKYALTIKKYNIFPLCVKPI